MVLNAKDGCAAWPVGSLTGEYVDVTSLWLRPYKSYSNITVIRNITVRIGRPREERCRQDSEDDLG